jgi:hypothetical protein
MLFLLESHLRSTLESRNVRRPVDFDQFAFPHRFDYSLKRIHHIAKNNWRRTLGTLCEMLLDSCKMFDYETLTGIFLKAKCFFAAGSEREVGVNGN